MVIRNTDEEYYLFGEDLPDEKYEIKDRKVRFFYQRFVKSLGNINSIKKSIEDLFLTKDELIGLFEKISDNVSVDRSYKISL